MGACSGQRRNAPPADRQAPRRVQGSSQADLSDLISRTVRRARHRTVGSHMDDHGQRWKPGRLAARPTCVRVCNGDRPQGVGQHEGTSAIRFGNPSASRRVTAAGRHDVEKELTTVTRRRQIERSGIIHCMSVRAQAPEGCAPRWKPGGRTARKPIAQGEALVEREGDTANVGCGPRD